MQPEEPDAQIFKLDVDVLPDPTGMTPVATKTSNAVPAALGLPGLGVAPSDIVIAPKMELPPSGKAKRRQPKETKRQKIDLDLGDKPPIRAESDGRIVVVNSNQLLDFDGQIMRVVPDDIMAAAEDGDTVGSTGTTVNERRAR